MSTVALLNPARLAVGPALVGVATLVGLAAPAYGIPTTASMTQASWRPRAMRA